MDMPDYESQLDNWDGADAEFKELVVIGLFMWGMLSEELNIGMPELVLGAFAELTWNTNSFGGKVIMHPDGRIDYEFSAPNTSSKGYYYAGRLIEDLVALNLRLLNQKPEFF